MKTNLKRWVGRVPDVSAVMARFPVATVLMALFTLVLIFINKSHWDEALGRGMAGTIIAAYICVCMTFAGEANGGSRRIALQAIISAVIIALAWFSEVLRLNLVMALGAVLLILGNLAIWRKSRDDLHVWDFTHKLWTGAIFAVVGSIIFVLGVMAIQAALKSLFGLRINDLTEHLILPIGLGFLAPLYWMSTLPAVDESYQELYETPGFVSKAVAFLGTWLLAPLTLIYTAIILAYGVKIILAGSLPKGEIAQLVTPFLIVGTLTWLLLEPPFVNAKALAKLFRKLWFPISIPAALLLAISVFVRIGEYGLTEERIALLFAVFWALGLGLWFGFGPKDKRDIRLIPASASVLLLVGTFGAGWLSIFNQSSQLDKYLAKAGISADMQNEITDKEAAKKAKGAIRYLHRKDADKALQASLAKVGYEGEISKLDDVYASLALQNIKVPSRYHTRHRQNARNYRRPDDIPISVAGYADLYGEFSNQFRPSLKFRKLATIDGVSMRTDFKTLKFSRDSDDRVDQSFDLLGWADGLPVQSDEDGGLIATPSIVSVYKDERIQIDMLVKTLNLWNDEDDERGMYLEYYLLTKSPH